MADKKIEPLITIIILTKDNISMLKNCLDSIENKSTYKNYEIIIVNNNSTKEKTKLYLANVKHKVLSNNEPFNFSRLNNIAVTEAAGEHIIFLNDDTSVISPDWIERMLEHSKKTDVGAVGAKLLYINNTVQHAGVLIGIGGVTSHAFEGVPRDHRGYQGLQSIRNCSAVTAACMMINKRVFEEIGGFNEHLAYAFNDVDLCLRLRNKGYSIVYTPYAELYHYTSSTRPYTVNAEEFRYFIERWRDFILQGDPYYDQSLSRTKPYSLKIKEERFILTDRGLFEESQLGTLAIIKRHVNVAQIIVKRHGPSRLLVELMRFLQIRGSRKLQAYTLRDGSGDKYVGNRPSIRIASKDIIGFDMKIEGIDTLKLNSIVRQLAQTRTKSQAYERFKNTIVQSPNPSQIKLNYIQRSTLYNFVRNLRPLSVARSLIHKYVRLLSLDEWLKSDRFNDSQCSKPAVHQFIPVLAPRDAAGNEVIAIRDMFRRRGYRSDIFVQAIHPEMYRESRKFTEYEIASPNDVVIYHMASYSELVDYILALPVRKVLIYHNITPYEFFVGVNDRAAASCKRGREQLRLLKDDVALAVTHSAHSKMELEDLGFRRIVVAPVRMNFDNYKTELENHLMSRYGSSTNIIYVGRISPHKKIEDLIQIFAYYNNCVDKHSNLFIVGSFSGMERYYVWLRSLIRKSKLKNVHLIRNADNVELATYYNVADVYISMSEHEGFCIPLVESMYFGVPIIAYDCTSIPHTLGDAGIRVKVKNFEEIAELIALMLGDDNLRNKITEKQKERFADIIQDNTLEETLMSYVKDISPSPESGLTRRSELDVI